MKNKIRVVKEVRGRRKSKECALKGIPVAWDVDGCSGCMSEDHCYSLFLSFMRGEKEAWGRYEK